MRDSVAGKFPPGKLWIIHHLELGDALICNGLVLEYAKCYDVTLICLRQALPMLCHLYDGTGVKLQSFDDTGGALRYAGCAETAGRILVVGWGALDTSIPFDVSFYRTAEVPLEMKWDGFGLKRRGELLPDSLGISRPYVFTHLGNKRCPPRFDWREHAAGIDTRIEPTPDKDGPGGVLSWLMIAELADAVIVSNSCFLNLIDISGIVVPNMVYVRSGQANEQPTLRSPWTVV